MDITLIGGVSAILATGILVQIIKFSKQVPKNFLPLISVITGIAVVCLGTWNISNLFVGLIIGASVSGMWDTATKTFGK